MRHRLIAAVVVLAAPIVLAQRGPVPSEPAPRFADGTPNLGRVAAEKGIWAVPWIRNMGLRTDKKDGGTDLPSSGGRVGLVN